MSSIAIEINTPEVSLETGGQDVSMETRNQNIALEINEQSISLETGQNITIDFKTVSLEGIDHDLLSGLEDDDHAQYLLASDATDRSTFAINWDDLTNGGETSLHSHAAQDASETSTDTTNFNNILSATEDTVQKALDALDDLSEIDNLLIKEEFQNYNPDLVDMGAEQVNDVRGYGAGHVAEKTFAYCKFGSEAFEEDGAVRTYNGFLQAYLNNEWEDIVTNFRFREDENGEYELEHKPIGFNSWIEVMSGNSDLLDPDGNPIVQQYKTNMGAYSTPLEIDGGTF
jgi:hypothetical protein